MMSSQQHFSSHARLSRTSLVPGSKPLLVDAFVNVKSGEVRRALGIIRTYSYWVVRQLVIDLPATTTTQQGSGSLSRFATFTLSRALSTATAVNGTQTQKLERIADELLDLTKLERHDYSILFRLKMGLNRYGPAISGIGSASSDSGPTSTESKVAEKIAFDIKIEKFDAAAKIKIIMEVRTFTDLGLNEAKELMEKVPVVVKKGLTKEEAGPIVDKLKELGATVVLE